MSERTWTEEEIRAAMGPILNCSNNEERIIAELNKPTPPPIHPDVPVMFNRRNCGASLYASLSSRSYVAGYEEPTNIRPLISTEAVMLRLVRAVRSSSCLQDMGVWISHYIKTGET